MPHVELSPNIEPSSELDEEWNNFVGVTKTLNKEQKESLNDFWAQYSSGKPKPTRTTVTEEEIKALIVEAMRLSFGATIIESPNDK